MAIPPRYQTDRPAPTTPQSKPPTSKQTQHQRSKLLQIRRTHRRFGECAGGEVEPSEHYGVAYAGLGVAATAGEEDELLLVGDRLAAVLAGFGRSDAAAGDPGGGVEGDAVGPAGRAAGHGGSLQLRGRRSLRYRLRRLLRLEAKVVV